MKGRMRGAGETFELAGLLFDAMLGVSHHSSAKEFQEEMVIYMPAAHRQMVLDFKQRVSSSGSVKDYVRRSSNQALRQVYNECVETFAGLRMFHFGISTKYLKATAKGTGSSTFRDMLKEAYDATKEAAADS